MNYSNINSKNIDLTKVKNAIYYKDARTLELTMTNNDILTINKISKKELDNLIFLGMDIKIQVKNYIIYGILDGPAIIDNIKSRKFVKMYFSGVPIKIAIESGLLGKIYIDERAEETYYSTLKKLKEMFPNINFNDSDTNVFLVKQEKSLLLRDRGAVGLYTNIGIVVDENYYNYLAALEHETIHHAFGEKESSRFNEYLVSYIHYALNGSLSAYYGSVYMDMLSSFISINDIVKYEKNNDRGNTKKILNQYNYGEFDIIDLMENDPKNKNIIEIKCKIIDMFFNYLYEKYKVDVSLECINEMDNFYYSMLNRSSYWKDIEDIKIVTEYYNSRVEKYSKKTGSYPNM